jgi:hypothetical protein
MSEQSTKLRDDSKPSRNGQKWTNQETMEVLEKLKSGTDYEKIAQESQRTVNAIKIHLMDTHIKRMVKHGDISIENVSQLIKIPVEDLKRYQHKIEQKKEKKKFTHIQVKKILLQNE